MLIFHGDNQISARVAYLEIKKQKRNEKANLIELDGGKITLFDIELSIKSTSLLGVENAVFIENFFSRRTSQEKKSIVEYLKKNPNLPIFIYESKNQSVQLKQFPPALVKLFNLPSSIFTFLDTFSISHLNSALKDSPPEKVLYLLSAHIHKMILHKQNKSNLPIWQSKKLTSQVAKYSLHQLFRMQKNLLELDYKNKTSSTPYHLGAALELWTLSI